MDEHGLLLRHLADWAAAKRRPFDPELVAEALALRWRQDELAAGDWEPGSVERLLLVTWPAYGEPVEDPGALLESLDTLWRFLRATGRMRSGSASPAELKTEARRASARMAAAFQDPGFRSAGRVLLDFGRSIGIDIEDAESHDEAQRRLDAIQTAWNALPHEERLRRLPDPGPKSAVGDRFTRQADDLLGPAEPTLRRGDAAIAAREARSSPFVSSCVALADWVGARRPVTGIGVLRPAVAREAYEALDLWQWERAYGRPRYPDEAYAEPEVARLLKDAALNAWTTAADCVPLDRLWYATVACGLVEVGATVAHGSGERPETDEDWVHLAAMLVVANAVRLDRDDVAPLLGTLIQALESPAGLRTAELREWWYSHIPSPEIRDDEFWRDLYDDNLDRILEEFDDTGIWSRDATTITLTDLGVEVTLALLSALEAGVLDEDGPW